MASVKHRLEKLEQSFKHARKTLVMIQFDNDWTVDQQQQIADAEKQGTMVLKIFCVDAKQNVDL